MSKDIFGLEKKSKSATQVSHPSMVALKLPTASTVSLCQSVQIDYQRQTQPIYELGSEDVYIAVQGASGTVQINRAINGFDKGKAWEPYEGSGCNVSDASITISSTANKECHAEVGNITCEGATLTRVGFQAQAGQAIITDSAEYAVGAVKKG